MKIRRPAKIKNPVKGHIDENFFNAMSYELAGEIGAIDNEEMKNNEKLITSKKNKSKRD